MHIRAMDFEPFSFRINDNALPELMEGYKPEAKKTGKTLKKKSSTLTGISPNSNTESHWKPFSD